MQLIRHQFYANFPDVILRSPVHCVIKCCAQVKIAQWNWSFMTNLNLLAFTAVSFTILFYIQFWANFMTMDFKCSFMFLVYNGFYVQSFYVSMSYFFKFYLFSLIYHSSISNLYFSNNIIIQIYPLYIKIIIDILS